jgi:hypothetical protein
MDFKIETESHRADKLYLSVGNWSTVVPSLRENSVVTRDAESAPRVFTHFAVAREDIATLKRASKQT